MLISRSLGRKALVFLFVIAGFVWLYETTILDSRFVTGHLTTRVDPTAPRPGARLKFGATAYCKGKTTASGVNVRSGIAAADPDLLPVGTVIQVDAPGKRHDGVYTIMDTGPKVKGRRLDLYMWSCYEALDFGYASVDLSVLRLGWNPQASEPTLIDRLFRRREAAKRSQVAGEAEAQAAKQIPPSTLPGPEPAPEPAVAVAAVPAASAPATDAPAATAQPANSETTPAADHPNRSRSDEGHSSSTR
jgi:3D (Asp-Asp-Asp) domain-containing protein